MRTTIAVLISLIALGAGPAWALCPHYADGPASGNVENGTAHAVCLQSELAGQADVIRQQSELRALVQDVQMQQVQQNLTMPPLPAPAF